VLRAVGVGLGLFQRPAAEFLDSFRRRGAGRSGITEAEIEALIAERVAARKSRDFKRADAIRAELSERGVTLEDGPAGTTWKIEK
jgi:cysteinyl-tRNA synthetase